jgi:hypothetical protein
VIETKDIHAAEHQSPQERRNLIVCGAYLRNKAAGAGFEQTRAGSRVHNAHCGSAVT